MSAITVETIPALCTIEDACRVLRMKRRTFYDRMAELKALGVLVEIRPRLDRRPRYRGQAIADFLSAEGQVKQTRAEMRQVR